MERDESGSLTFLHVFYERNLFGFTLRFVHLEFFCACDVFWIGLYAIFYYESHAVFLHEPPDLWELWNFLNKWHNLDLEKHFPSRAALSFTARHERLTVGFNASYIQHIILLLAQSIFLLSHEWRTWISILGHKQATIAPHPTFNFNSVAKQYAMAVVKTNHMISIIW